MDAWFAGFQRRLTAIVWIGFDLPRSLGNNETGAAAALPMWISYMWAMLKDVPEEAPAVPEGVVAVRVNPDTGLREPGGQGGLAEYFYRENVPPEGDVAAPATESQHAARKPEDVKSDLY